MVSELKTESWKTRDEVLGWTREVAPSLHLS